MNEKRVRILRLMWIAAILLLAGIAFILMKRESAPWLYRLFRFFDTPCEPPKAFGGFHCVFLSICVIISVIFSVFGAQNGKSITDNVVFSLGVVLLVLELFKQFYYYFILNKQVYDFSILPFQFCSLALYLFLLTPLLNEGKLKEALYRFLALFGTMGGCLVMAYPAFYPRLSLCFHTMIWHIIMVSGGLFILFSRGYGRRYREEMIPGTLVFLPLLTVAMLLNVFLTPLVGDAPGPLNLFYISPYEKCTYLIIRDVQAALGWFPALVTYALMFIFIGATTVFWAAFLIRFLAERLVGKRKREDLSA